MKVILFGATGMVGQGVLRECLLDPDVEAVLSIGRNTLAKVGLTAPAPAPQSEKLEEIAHSDLYDLSALADAGKLDGFGACFFCLGVSSAGMSEADYRHVTYDLTLSIARTLVRTSAGMTFIYVSGAGTNAKSRSMWARVKGETENALLELPFRSACMFRPGGILPMHGIKSRTRLYRILIAIMAPLYPVWKVLMPNMINTTESVGRAMLAVAKTGAPKPIFEPKDINSATA